MIDEERKIKQSRFAEEVDAAIQAPAKLEIKLRDDNVDIAYLTMLQVPCLVVSLRLGLLRALEGLAAAEESCTCYLQTNQAGTVNVLPAHADRAAGIVY